MPNSHDFLHEPYSPTPGKSTFLNPNTWRFGLLHTVDGRNPAPPGMYKTL